MFWRSLFCPLKSSKKRDDKADPSFVLQVLPTELKQQVASFLPVRDLLTLAETSKRMSSELGITVVSSPLTDKSSQNRAFVTAYSTQLFAAIVSKQESPSEPFSTVFSCTIVADMSSDGAVWIVEQDLSQKIDERNRAISLRSVGFRDGKVVAMAWTRPKTKLVLQFLPKANKYYQFWVNTRGYKERTKLCLHKMSLHRIGLGKKPPGFTAFQFDLIPWYIENWRRYM